MLNLAIGSAGRSAAALLLVTALGCSGSGPAEEGDQATEAADENLGSTSQAFSWGQFYSKSQTGNTPWSETYTDLGSDTNRTCFLAGVGGNLRSLAGSASPPGFLATEARAGAWRTGGRWRLLAQPGDETNKVQSKVMCVNSIAGRTSVVHWTGGAAKVLAPVTANRRCFLTMIENTNPYWDDDDFNADSDEVRIWSDGTSWWLGGNGHAHGEAMCLDVANVVGDYAKSQTGSGTSTTDIGYNDQVPGTQCFLTGVKGRFRTDDYAQGVFIGYNSGLNRYTLTVTGPRGARAACIE